MAEVSGHIQYHRYPWNAGSCIFSKITVFDGMLLFFRLSRFARIHILNNTMPMATTLGMLMT